MATIAQTSVLASTHLRSPMIGLDPLFDRHFSDEKDRSDIKPSKATLTISQFKAVQPWHLAFATKREGWERTLNWQKGGSSS